MKYQIDQSGKIEQTSVDTVIALSNGQQYSLALPGKVKRALQEIFRDKKRSRMFIYETFSVLIVLVLIETKPKTKVLIDNEYLGQQNLLSVLINEHSGKFFSKNPVPVFEFGFVGKSSPAHVLAAKVGTKKIKPNKTVSLEEIVEVLWPLKKTGYSAINGTEGNLTQDWVPGGRKPSRSLVSKLYHKNRRKSR